MILAFVALLLTQTPPPETADDEIVVIGRRFQQASVIVGKDGQGRFTCSLTVSSGNARLDERLCKAASKCVIKGKSDPAIVRACVDRNKPGLFEQFRKERQQTARASHD